MVMEFGQESSNEDAIGKEEDGGEPTFDESLGTYTSHKKAGNPKRRIPR